MIVRMWRGPTPKWRGPQYEETFKATALVDYTKTAGNRGVYLLRRDIGDQYEFMAMTFWDSLDAVKCFAGEDYMRPKYYKEDHELFTVLNPLVDHFEVVQSHGGKASLEA